jgi:pimeloyl-ACP methyl ester carboxylesterase
MPMNLEVPTRLGRVAVTTQGTGPLLVLVPAAGRAAADFAPIVPALARDYRVAALDWPGTGASPPAERPRDATASAFASVLGVVIDALDEPAVVLGHSVGGFAAARLAVDDPDRVRGLVLVDALGFIPFGRFQRAFCAVKGLPSVTRAVEGYLARAQTIRRNAHTADVFARVDAALAQPAFVEITAALWRSFPHPESDLREAAKSIRCPTLVCWGWLDPVVPVIGAYTAARTIPGAQLALFRTGHTPFVEDTAGFLRKLQGFLVGLVGELRDERLPSSRPAPGASGAR